MQTIKAHARVEVPTTGGIYPLSLDRWRRTGSSVEEFMQEPMARETDVILLVRVGQDPIDQAAWDAFVASYAPAISGWCRRRGLQPADAEDVTQDVLLAWPGHYGRFNTTPPGRFAAGCA